MSTPYSVPVEGTIIAGKYRLVSLLGEGGMGVVWRAEHQDLHRAVAIKFMRSELVGNPDLVRRFVTEARSAALVRHPNIVDVFDVGTLDSGVPFLVMEWLEGESLHDRLSRPPELSILGVVGVLERILSALALAHSKGVVHRDLKPENIFLVRSASGIIPKLLDFGIAKVLSEPSKLVRTQTGAVIGTPGYMSPEQVTGERDVDERSDLFSLGAVTYEMLSGEKPFRTDGGALGYLAILTDEPRPIQLRRPEVPDELAAWVHRCLAKDRRNRFASATDAMDALAAISFTSRNVSAPPPIADPPRLPPSLAPPPPPLPIRQPVPSPVAVVNASPSEASDRESEGRVETLVVSKPRGFSTQMWLVYLLAFAALGALIALIFRSSPEESSATIAPTEQPSTEPEAAPVVVAHQLSPWEPLGVAAVRWRVAAAALSTLRTQIARRADGLASLVVQGAVSPAVPSSLTAHVGAAEAMTSLDGLTLFTPSLRRPKEVVNLRERPDGQVLRALPWGTIVVALAPSAAPSTHQPSTAWTFSAPNEAQVGWISSELLEPYDGCVPDLRSLRPHLNDGDARLTNTTISRVPVVRGSSQGLGYLLVGRDPDIRRSYLGLFADAGDCALEEKFWHLDETRVPREVTPVRSGDRAGETMLVVQWEPVRLDDPSGHVEWSMFAPAPYTGTEWRRTLLTGGGLPRRERSTSRFAVKIGPFDRPGYWPFGVRAPDGSGLLVAWEGDRFVETDLLSGVSSDGPTYDPDEGGEL